MPTESSPASAFNNLGQRLRAERNARQLSIQDVSTQLRLPVSIVEAMEHDDHAVLGAAVFARGRLSSYARLMEVPMLAVDALFADSTTAPPPLVSAMRSSRIERKLQRVARQGIYVVLTATIVLPVIWLATHDQLPQSTASLTALDTKPVATQHAVTTTTTATATAATAAHAAINEARNEAPVAASMAPFGDYRWSAGDSAQPTPASVEPAANAATALQMRFSGDSWIDIVGADGQVIERGTVEAGSVRNYQASAVARVTIGNLNSVMVLENGHPLDLQPFQNANVARFTLSSDGKPAPAHD